MCRSCDGADGWPRRARRRSGILRPMSALRHRRRRGAWALLPPAIAATAAALLLAAGCGGGGDGGASAGAADPGPVHVHGLGVNPSDGALFVATHTGLFRMPEGSQRAERVGDRRQDTMGFTVVGPDRFLGSGHPDLRDDLPPHLGLIESTDAGRSWRPVSLLGEADFHALRASGRRVLGHDATGARLMESEDGGRTWTVVRRDVALYDVAAHPGDPSRLVAAGEAGLAASADGGATWRDLGARGVLLAWPRADRLYALAPDGAVMRTSDGGATWVRRGALPGEPAALTATGPEALIAALHDGRLVSSGDGGRTWLPGAWS